MGKRIFFMFLILSLVLLSGCANIKDKMAELDREYGNKDIKNTIEDKVCPECEKCEEPITMDVVSYLFDKQTENLVYFMSNSEKFLYCQLPIIENKNVSDSILNLDNNLRKSSNGTVKIIVDKTGTMDYCQVACIPKLSSYYSTLYSKGISIKYVNIHYSYCVNEKGVYITSKMLNKDDTYSDYALFIRSDQLSKVFKDKFEQVWKSG